MYTVDVVKEVTMGWTLAWKRGTIHLYEIRS